MSAFGENLIQSLNEALAHSKGKGPAIVHAPVAPREVRKQAKLTQAQMAFLMGMSLSGYRKWEQGTRRVSGPGSDSSAHHRERPQHCQACTTAVALTCPVLLPFDPVPGRCRPCGADRLGRGSVRCDRASR